MFFGILEGLRKVCAFGASLIVKSDERGPASSPSDVDNYPKLPNEALRRLRAVLAGLGQAGLICAEV